jgi:hypothetical protein
MTDKEKLYVRFAKELEAVSTYNDYRQRIHGYFESADRRS